MIQKTNGALTADEYWMMHQVLKMKPTAFCTADWYGTKIERFVIYLEDENNCFKVYPYAHGLTRKEAWQNAMDEVGKEMLEKLESYS